MIDIYVYIKNISSFEIQTNILYKSEISFHIGIRIQSIQCVFFLIAYYFPNVEYCQNCVPN